MPISARAKKRNAELRKAVKELLGYLQPWLEDQEDDYPSYAAYKRVCELVGVKPR